MVNGQFDNSLALGLLEAAPDALVLANAQGQIVFVNAQGEALFGYPRAELYGQPVEVLLADTLRAIHTEMRASFTAAPEFREMGRGLSLRCRRRDGTEIPVEVSLSSVQTKDGLFIAAAVRDVTARYLAQKALRDAEERFRLTFEEAPIGMALVGLDDRFLQVNHSLCRLLGYSSEELTTLSFQTLTHPDDLKLHVAEQEQIARGEQRQFQISKRYIRKDGSVVATMLSVSVVRDSAGSPLHFIAHIEDITERRRAEEALRRSEESLARAQRVAHMGSWDWDLLTNEVVRSAEFFEIYGLTPDQKISQALSLIDSVHPDDRKQVTANVTEAVREGSGFQFEYRIIRTDGVERVMLTQGDVVRKEGRAVRMVGTVRDITERKRLQRAREDTLRWLHTVLDQCPVAIMLLHGAHGQGVKFNKRAQALISRTDDGIEQNRDILLFQELMPLTGDNHPCTRVLRGERIEDLELSLQNKHGEGVPILLHAAPIMDEGGGIQGAVVVFQDITLAKQIDRLRSEWNSLIAHDLRQPLNSIMLTAQLIERRQRNTSEFDQPIGQIISSARRLNRMINDLLDLSRLEVGQLTLARQPIDLPALIRTSIERSTLEVSDRRCDLFILNEVPFVNIDADRIAQVMDNLLSNAQKYGAPGTPITIEIEYRGEEVAVAVTNLGEGIAADELPYLFQRFHRTADAKSGPIKGIGLGLYIVQQLVAAHGGLITAESTPGGTTTFRFTLPTTNLTLKSSSESPAV